jgi:hypothetical protein
MNSCVWEDFINSTEAPIGAFRNRGAEKKKRIPDEVDDCGGWLCLRQTLRIKKRIQLDSELTFCVLFVMSWTTFFERRAQSSLLST